MATYEGGKAWGSKVKEFEQELDREIEASIDTDFSEFSREELQGYKHQFIRFSQDKSGYITLNDLAYMMEKLEQSKTRLELRKMILEVDEDGDGAISFREFVKMSRKGTASVLALILAFEENRKGRPVPHRDSLPHTST